MARAAYLWILAAIVLLGGAVAFAARGVDVWTNDPNDFLEVLAEREPLAPRVIYVVGWAAPVEALTSWAEAGYEVRAMLPDGSPEELLARLRAAGVEVRLTSGAPTNGLAFAPMRTILTYEGNGTWRILSSAQVMGLYPQLEATWQRLASP